jgi:ribosome-binding protein aMBF1 (putative translation factor)
MPTITLLHSEFVGLTNVSSDDTEMPVISATAPSNAVRYLINPVERQPAQRDGSTDINDLVRRHEEQPGRLEAIRRARRRLSEENVAADGRRTLQSLRLSKGLSQTQLAGLVGTTQSHIARIEAGRCDVQVSTLKRLANALEVPPADIIDLINA